MKSPSEPQEFRRIDVEEARKELEAGTARVIDVRMPFDYAGGRIPGSINLPNNAIRARRAEVSADQELFFLSEDGKRSVETCRVACSLGFQKVANIEGGFAAWQEAGYPTETISEGVSSPI